MKAHVDAFNQEKALVGAFSVIVKSSRTFGKPSFEALAGTAHLPTINYGYFAEFCTASVIRNGEDFLKNMPDGPRRALRIYGRWVMGKKTW